MSGTEYRADRSLAKALDAVPIFPLPQLVLFPEAVLPLHVFEPRYRAMLRHCLLHHGAIVVAQILNGEDEHGRPRIAPIAGGGIVIEHQPLPDGRSNIVILGQARLSLQELPPEEPAPGEEARPFRMAKATILEDLAVSVREHDAAALIAAATMFATEVKKHDASFTFKMPGALDASHVADLCAFQLVIDAGVRQAILDELDPRVRVEMVIGQLALQHGAMLHTDKKRVTVLN